MAYLSHLSLTNFRNLVQLDLELPPGVLVFFGTNAQGKTALLEAVYLLAIARSFRAENEREVVNFRAALEGQQALVGGTVQKRDERLTVYVGYQPVPHRGSFSGSSTPDQEPSDTSSGQIPAGQVPAGQIPASQIPGSDSGEGAAGVASYSVRKEIRVSRVRRTAAELVGMVGGVLFNADDIQLVYGPPAGRRRYLDILLSQCDPLYIKALQRYQRVVQQRNQLLRLIRDGRAESAELDFWDQELIREGSWLTWQRQGAMKNLARFGADHHQQLSGLEEEFCLEYRSSVSQGENLTETEDYFRETLAVFRRRELATATTVVGPHRDDFQLLVDGVDMGTFASRGQARTLALTLRLAEAAYLSSVRAEEPILLLDDVLSEMDSLRRRRVLEKITQYEQAMITTTDVGLVREALGTEATYFRVEGGEVLPAQDGGVEPSQGNPMSPAP